MIIKKKMILKKKMKMRKIMILKKKMKMRKIINELCLCYI